MHENHVFFLPVNILTVWCASSWATRHTTMCLDLLCISYTYWKPHTYWKPLEHPTFSTSFQRQIRFSLVY